MKVETKGHTTTIRDTQGDLTAFIGKLEHEHKTFENQNLIIDISLHKGLKPKALDGFAALVKTHRKAGKSIVIVASELDFNGVSDKIMVVPTRQEALDIIEMEEIERDLGF